MGTWGIVAASQSACEIMLADFADLNHIHLASGSCLPIRPGEDLIAYLRAHPDSDFIESATVSGVPWSIGGLHKERFHLHFPFAWKRRRWLFDLSVRIQQTLGLKRRLPRGITPHLGSQWWCLTRSTISAVLNDRKRPIFERYFRRVWIPDESYFQTLVRRHSNQIESRSMTLANFDIQGKPHVFYNDHREMLRQSGYFVARKIWAGANKLYTVFPMVSYATPETTSGNPDRAPDTLYHLVCRIGRTWQQRSRRALHAKQIPPPRSSGPFDGGKIYRARRVFRSFPRLSALACTGNRRQTNPNTRAPVRPRSRRFCGPENHHKGRPQQQRNIA